MHPHVVFEININTEGVTEIIILVNSRPFLVERINGKQLITALFIYASNFLTWPFPLSDIRILHCCELDAVVVIISLDCVQYKRMLLPHGRSHVFYFWCTVGANSTVSIVNIRVTHDFFIFPVLHHSWVDGTSARWVRLPSTKVEKIVKTGIPPPPNYVTYQVKIRKLVGKISCCM